MPTDPYDAQIDMSTSGDAIAFRWKPLAGPDESLVIKASDITSCQWIVAFHHALTYNRWYTAELAKKFEMLAVAILFKRHVTEQNEALLRTTAGRN